MKKLKALITGASSGIGRDMARVLSSKGYDLILVARNKKELEKLKDELKTNVEIISMDLSDVDNCKKLYEQVKDKNIDILINNAGFGNIGSFRKTDMDKELSMIDLNIKAVHILTKLFLNDFVERDSGYILNVSSASAFQPGPLMATYYSTKSYVYHLTLALYEELRHIKSNVKVSCLCPGPVNTNFNEVANCEFKMEGLSSEYVAKYAIDKMLKNKLLIIPGFTIKLVYIFGRFIPNKLKMRITYNIQHRKTK
ncbi:MAG: SDR family oxidoreductase [Firmicutes bacterium]|nr:SDR family oxidoreductase [Bacillota bacterium]